MSQVCRVFLAGGLLLSCALVPLRTARAAPCHTVCDVGIDASHPITILVLGESFVPGWVPGCLTTAACDGCVIPSTGIIAEAVDWTTARGWTPERFRGYDVIAVDGTGAGNFQVFSLTLEETDPWLPAFRQARRALVTGLHADSGTHYVPMSSFRQFVQNAVVWLAEDECACAPASQGVMPGILIVCDQSAKPFAYTPWRGLARSYEFGDDALSNCMFTHYEYDEVVINVPVHPVLQGLSDSATVPCSGNTVCSLDHADQSVHALWQAGVGLLPGGICGYEDNGFASIMTALKVVGGSCRFLDCGAEPGATFDGVEATLARELQPGIEPAPSEGCSYPIP